MMRREELGTNSKKSKLNRYGSKIIVIVLWFILWQLLSVVVRTPLLLAGPVDTFLHLIKDVCTASFWYAIMISSLRIISGLFTGFLLGALLAGSSYKLPVCKLLLAPLLHFCKAVPVASFAVILLVWWGADFISFAICFLVVLPISYINILEGLEQTDKKMLEMAAIFKMPLKNKLFYIYRPALYSFLESSLKTGLGMGIKAGVAAEVIGITRNSIGGSLYSAKIYLDTAGVFSWTIVVILLSVSLERAALGILDELMKISPEMAVSKEEKRINRIVIKDISKSYQEKTVLEHINKEISHGKCICVMAPSGYGKTTLLHMVAGIVTPNSGRVMMDREQAQIEISYTTGKGNPPVGMVFQEDRLCERLDAVQNVALIGTTFDTARNCLTELLPQSQLHQPICKLSGGMKRRVCIARALASRGAVLLLDEPFSGMDEDTKAQTIKVIKEYQRNRPMIITTHNKKDIVLLGGELWNLGALQGE